MFICELVYMMFTCDTHIVILEERVYMDQRDGSHQKLSCGSVVQISHILCQISHILCQLFVNHLLDFEYFILFNHSIVEISHSKKNEENLQNE